MAFTENDVLNTACLLLSKDLHPAVSFKLLKDVVRAPENDGRLKELKKRVLYSGLVKELESEQKYDGSWGRFLTKDYTLKKKFPTTAIAVERALYIGLDKSDDLLFNALEYIKGVIQGEIRLTDTGEVNERWPAMQKYRIAYYLEKIEPNSEYTDEIWNTWLYIINRAFREGTYNYELDKQAQREVFGITGSRLIPLPFKFIMLRGNHISPELEQSLLSHCWERHCINGYYWSEAILHNLPSDFYYSKTRRWFYPLEFFSGFRQNGKYLWKAMEWLWNGRSDEGLWDFGPQIKDPFGYFCYLSEDGWRKAGKRAIDCTVEVLVLLRRYIDFNR